MTVSTGLRRPSFFDADFDDLADLPLPRERARSERTPSPPPRRRRGRVVGLLAAVAVGLAVTVVVPAATASADPSASDWSRLRQCESSGNYAINTGNGYYGAYQFDLATWRSVGGSGYPNQASPAEQDARALELYRMRGWQPWTCARILGLHEDADARSGVAPTIPAPAPAAPTAPTAGAAPAWPGPQYFSYGDNSPTVAQFQRQLAARGLAFSGTGQFGPNTLAAVNHLQAANGIPVTGLLGPVTWGLAWTGNY